MVLIPGFTFAQDSTSAVGGGASSVIDSVFALVTGKWPVIATIGSILFLISEVLGGIPAVKQNSVYQVVFSILSKLFSKKSS